MTEGRCSEPLGSSSSQTQRSEALSADRPYRDAMDPEQVRSIMRGDVGTAFCPEALGALEATRELGPVGLATPTAATPRSAS